MVLLRRRRRRGRRGEGGWSRDGPLHAVRAAAALGIHAGTPSKHCKRTASAKHRIASRVHTGEYPAAAPVCIPPPIPAPSLRLRRQTALPPLMRACAGGQGVDAAALPTEALTRSFNWGDGQALAPDSRTSAHQRARTRARALRQADRPRRRSNAIRPAPPTAGRRRRGPAAVARLRRWTAYEPANEHTDTLTQTHTQTQTHRYTNTRTHAHKHARTNARKHTHSHRHTLTLFCTHARTRTHIHVPAARTHKQMHEGADAQRDA